MNPQAFADALDGLMRDLLQSFDLELPPANPAALEAGLRELASEEPGLAPLILGFLDSEGLHQENSRTVHRSAFHPLDEALNALYDLSPGEKSAFHAAYGFRAAGAGVRALSRWIAKTGEGELPLAIAMGCPLEPMFFPASFKLLGECEPPNNHALYDFIHHNAVRLDPDQRRTVVRLVTWPVRTDSDRLADVLGWVAFKHFPEALEIQQMWCRWIETGAFDGRPSTPRDLARYLADAAKEGLHGWEPINDTLRVHVKSFLRSCDGEKIRIAINHIMAAADRDASVLSSLLQEAGQALGSSEWNRWRTREPDTARQLGWKVSAIVEEATGDRKWLRALEESKKAADFEEKRQRLLLQDKPQSRSGGAIGLSDL